MPQRIQRKRSKGWRMPAGAVCVTRPSRWGNPFTHEDSAYAVAAFREMVVGSLDSCSFGWKCDRWIHTALDLPADVTIGEQYADGDHNGLKKPYLFRPTPGFEEPLKLVAVPNCLNWRKKLELLRGKDLACFCSLDKPCHADVLLELANAG